MKQPRRRTWPWLLLLVFIGVAVQFARWPSGWADAIYLGVTLPAWSRVTSPLVTLVPGSLSAALLLLLAVVVIVAVLSGRGPRRRAGRLVLWLLALAVATFPFTFGLGYHTTPLEERLGLTNATGGAGASLAPPSTAMLTNVAEAVLAVLDESAALASVASVDDGQPHSTAAAVACVEEYVATFTEEPRATVAGRVKSLPAGWMLRFDFAGVVNPWLLEPHVDAGLTTASGLAVALHELAHTVGFVREAEAEAVALMAGMTCQDASVRYAASLRAATTYSALLDLGAREEYVERWPSVAKADTAAAAAVRERFRSAGASDLAAGVYDAYLSSQGTVDGLDDYGRAATIVAHLIGRDGAPTVRGP